MKKLLSLLFAVLCLGACMENELQPEYYSDSDTLYASMESIDATRTSMDEYNNVLWSENDQLIAFMKTTLGIKYQIKEQYVGTTTGGFSKVQDAGSGDDLESGQEIDHNVVLYPHSDQVWCMKYDNSTPAKAYKLNVVLPETQAYAENSFGNGAFPMVAVSTNNQLTFKNICGGVKLQFKGVDKIKSIKLEGLGNEAISGKSSVVAYADGSTPTITMASTASKSVTLDCGDGVQLNESSPTTFIVAVPPVTFALGMKITITDTDGMVKTLTNSSSNTVKRSTLLKFPVITYKQDGVLEFPEGALTSYELPAEGGTIEIPVVTNLEYEVIIPDSAKDWINIVDTKALREEVITLSVAANSISTIRSAEVTITDNKGAILQTITVNQDALKAQYPEDNEIWYTSKNNAVISPMYTDVFGAKIISNTYEDGKGVITFDSPVTQIGDYAFYESSRLTSITIPDNVTSIGHGTFCKCSELAEFKGKFAADNGRILLVDGKLAAFAPSGLSEYTIPDGVTSIGYEAFRECDNLTDITISNSVSVIDDHAFQNCDNITEITIPDSVTSIGEYAFDYCKALANVNLGTGVRVIKYVAFYGCQSLTSITIPDNITEIGREAFESCINLESVYCLSSDPPTGNSNMFKNNASGLKIYVPFGSSERYKTASGWSTYADCIFEMPYGENFVNLSVSGTANSYIVSEAGSYKFTPTKGNSNESVGTIASAEVLWETFGTDVTPNVGDLVKDVNYAEGFIGFETPETFKEGNAVIAAKDASGTILWSWHIWLTDKPESQMYYSNAGIMMDRNLGATSATPGDVGALGLLYQWGRKDPFLGASSIDENNEAKSTITWPSKVSSNSSYGTIAYTINNPTTFIGQNRNNYDWYFTEDVSTDDTRWTSQSDHKSIYDPCPYGWRVPDGDKNGIWATAVGSAVNFSNYPYDSSKEGMNFSGKFGSISTIWYPASGCRYNYYDCILYKVGSAGYYWSASPCSHSVYILEFLSSGKVRPSYTENRADGYSVRCIQE